MYATLDVILISIVVAASVTWTVKLLNFLLIKPRKLEKFLRNQGLGGNPYRPFLGDVKDYVADIKAEQTRSIELSGDILPHIFAYYHRIISKYGPNSFLWFGPWPRLNIADPELIKEILLKPDVYEKPFPETIKILTGGLVYLNGEKWAKHRKIVNSAFHLEKLKNMVPAIGLSCSSMLDKWKAVVSTNDEGRCEIDVWPYLGDLTGDVISRTAFGISHEEGRRIFQLMREKISSDKVNSNLQAMAKEIQSRIRGIIEKRKKAMERGDAIPSDDLLSILLESNSRFVEEDGNKNSGMSIEDVIEECQVFYFAGSETAASWLVWTMVLLCKHPEWQTQARDEVIRVFGNSEPRVDGLNRLKTVTMILQEVLRLYPSVPLVVRGPTETVKLGNLTIPAGVHLTLLIGLLHYDPEIWGEDAKEFNPRRFSEGVSNAAKIQSSFIPFTAGPRVCIGQNFAMIEAKMALAMILQRFSFELSPSYLHSPFSILTLQPQYGAPLILRSLESSLVS